MQKEWLRANVWIPPELQDSPLRKLAEHYVDKGWSISDVIACDMALKEAPVLSILDLPLEQRRSCGRQLPTDRWVIQVDLNKGGNRRNVRTLRFAHSSVASPWLDHPVEVEFQVADDTVDRKHGKREPREMKTVLEELAVASEATLASWAVVSSYGAGPSMAELLQGNRPSYVDLATVFLSELEFDEHAIVQIPGYAHKEHWTAGWLSSVHPYWGLSISEENASEFEKVMWRLLSSWARRQKRW